MPLLKQWKEGGALWGIWKVTESPMELEGMLTEASCIPEELALYKSPSRRLEYLAVRVLLFSLLGNECRIGHHLSGKPFLFNLPLHLTVSHTKGYVAVGIHPDKEISIDIEQVAERVRKVTARFVRADELPGLEDLAPEKQLYGLLLVWSAKESLFKIMNASEVDFLEHLQIEPFRLDSANLTSVVTPPFRSAGSFMAHEYRTPEQRTYVVRYWIHSDFVCTYILS